MFTESALIARIEARDWPTSLCDMLNVSRLNPRPEFNPDSLEYLESIDESTLVACYFHYGPSSNVDPGLELTHRWMDSGTKEGFRVFIARAIKLPLSETPAIVEEKLEQIRRNCLQNGGILRGEVELVVDVEPLPFKIAA